MGGRGYFGIPRNNGGGTSWNIEILTIASQKKKKTSNLANGVEGRKIPDRIQESAEGSTLSYLRGPIIVFVWFGGGSICLRGTEKRGESRFEKNFSILGGVPVGCERRSARNKFGEGELNVDKPKGGGGGNVRKP